MVLLVRLWVRILQGERGFYSGIYVYKGPFVPYLFLFREIKVELWKKYSCRREREREFGAEEPEEVYIRTNNERLCLFLSPFCRPNKEQKLRRRKSRLQKICGENMEKRE